jgi:hemerythrin superfamily protein
MNILEMIEQDHRKVESLFEEIKKAKDAKKSMKLFNEIYKELNLHAKAEELVFYPAMREYDETAEFIEEAEEEHADAETFLEEMKEFNPKDAEFKEKLEELVKAVKHHVEEEESEIFEAVRKCMDDKQLQALGKEFETAKSKLQDEVQEALTA